MFCIENVFETRIENGQVVSNKFINKKPIFDSVNVFHNF